MSEVKRVALVTGGTGGIGTAICQALSGQGYQVVAGFQPGSEEKAQSWLQAQQALGLECSLVAGDVADYDSAARMVEQVESEQGAVACLVNNAGIIRDVTLRKMAPEQWKSVMQTNLDSVFNVTRPAIEGMIAQGFGRVINIASINGLKGQAGQTNYAAAKAGMHGFTKSLALEVASKGVTVNTVSPGYVATEMVMSVPEPIRESIIAQIPVGRLAEPEEIARMVAFLADTASGFITGANFSVNGGQYML